MLPKEFNKTYLTQQMAMKIGSQTLLAEYYWDGIEEKIKRLLIAPIEKESGRGFPDVLNYIKSLPLTDFILKCKKFSK